MADTTCEVSVIVCVRNGAQTILGQLEALNSQRGAPPFEVIVVNNRSTDSTRQTVQQWLGAASPVPDSMRLVEANRRASIPYARNVGAALARGRVIAFCDADDRVEPGWVAAFAEAVREDMLAGGKIIPSRKSLMPPGWGSGLFATSYLRHIANCNCAIERETFLRIGGYDESLPRYGFEDVELSWHAQEQGVELAYIPSAVVHFTVSGNRASVRKKFHLGRGRVLMARRYPGYDSRPYPLRSTLADWARVSGRIVTELISHRRVSRQQLGAAVAALGRVAGSLQYSGTPKNIARKGIAGD